MLRSHLCDWWVPPSRRQLGKASWGTFNGCWGGAVTDPPHLHRLPAPTVKCPGPPWRRLVRAGRGPDGLVCSRSSSCTPNWGHPHRRPCAGQPPLGPGPQHQPARLPPSLSPATAESARSLSQARGPRQPQRVPPSRPVTAQETGHPRRLAWWVRPCPPQPPQASLELSQRLAIRLTVCHSF